MNTERQNRSAFLQTQREFSDKVNTLSLDIFRAYVDIAQKVNDRIIGVFAKNRSVITGESWFLTSVPLQTQRQIYEFSAAGNIPHGLNLSGILGFTRIFGTFTDGSNPTTANWYPLPYVDATSATDQIQVVVTPTNIVITAGGGSPPSIVRGFVVLEWLVRTTSTPSQS